MADKHPCSVRVYPADHAGGFRGHMCQKSGKVERDGKWYCGIHDPVAVQAKNAAAKARFDAEYDARRKRWSLEAAAPEMLKTLKRMAEGWANVIELELLPPQHLTSARILRDEARAAIAKAENVK